jgi:uncharacterized protein (TIGR02246 family)
VADLRGGARADMSAQPRARTPFALSEGARPAYDVPRIIDESHGAASPDRAQQTTQGSPTLMTARSPEELDRLFSAAPNAGDIEALMRLYEPQAALRPAPGQVAQGTAAIRAALTGFLRMKPQLAVTSRLLGQGNDIALMTGRWTLKGTGADGNPVQMTGQSAEVARRQPDGSWLFVVDAPRGLESDAAGTA